ncbi:MAG: ABC transporter permease [Tissierellia bacterium]|nr:ABC transporter permease [Tissierellia bacterium]MDD4781442.1 ABC transporter permease [Tissierellia bacterium]
MIILNIIIKDIKIIFSDKKALAIIIIMPLVLMTILSFALKGSFASSDEVINNKVKIAVVKKYDEAKDTEMFKSILKSSFLKTGFEDLESVDLLDELNVEDMFFNDFLDSEEVKKIISYNIEEENKSLEMLDNSDISAIILLPEKYVYDMKMNLLTPFRNKIDIKILTHPDRNIEGQIVKSIVKAYSDAISTIAIGKNVIIEASNLYNIGDGGLEGISDLIEGMTESIQSINIDIDDVMVDGRKSITSGDYYAVAMMTMFILYAASHGGRMLLEEKDNKTYQRMIIGDISEVKVLFGKFFTVFIIAIVQIIIMVIYSSIALKVDWGNLYYVTIISVTAAFSVAGVGAFIASLTFKAGNYKVANIFESAIIQVMSLLGGSFFPIDILPNVIQKLNIISINGIVLKSYLKVIKGHGGTDIINNIILLLIIGVLFTILSVAILKEGRGRLNDKYHKVENVKA